jgi:ABC-2 type transport system ATP-binding protein
VIRRLPGVRTATAHESEIRIHSDLSVDNLSGILKQLINGGAVIRSVEEQEPNLETVFLTLTGRNLRD